jgi:hypothetical protein
MNVARGVFRLWIFVTALWIVCVGFAAYVNVLGKLSGTWGYVGEVRDEPWKLDWSRPYYENHRSPSKEKLNPQFHAVRDEHVDGWVKSLNEGKMEVLYDQKNKLYLDSALTKDDQNYLLEEFKKQRWLRWIEASQYWALGIFGPPIALFVFGWAVLWVGRGFKTA